MQSLNLADASDLVSLEDFFHTHIWAGCSTLSFLLIKARNVQRSRRSLHVCFKIKHFLNWSQDEDRCPINSHHYWRTSWNRQLNPVWAQCCQGCTHPKSWSQHLLGHLVRSQLEKAITLTVDALPTSKCHGEKDYKVYQWDLQASRKA